MMHDQPIDARFVIAALEDASNTLRALPHSGFSTKLSQGRNDVVQEQMEAYGWTEIQVRAPIPSAAKITAMEEILSWVSFIRQTPVRKIVNWRSVTYPVSGKPLAWTLIGRLLAPNDPIERHSIKRWHENGIDQIVAALSARPAYHLQHLGREVEDDASAMLGERED